MADSSAGRRGSHGKPPLKSRKSVTWENNKSSFNPHEVVRVVRVVVVSVVLAVVEFAKLNGKALLLLGADLKELLLPPKPKSLLGALVLVTGSGQNLGRELSLELARQGARLVLWDLDEDNNDETRELIQAAGGEAYTFTCDISDQRAVAATAKKVKEQVGHVDYVINNAGTYRYKPFLSHTPHDMSTLVNVNLLGPIWVTREFLGPMVERNSGHVVCVSSVLGYLGRPNVVPYCASKFGVKGLTEALGEELRQADGQRGKSKVHVTAVHPFLIDNVNDVKPDLKFPGLFQILTTSDAAQRIIHGIRTNQEEIFLPEKLKPFFVYQKLLPRSLRRLFGDYAEN